ncbi:hypothetical protein TSUD_107430 [Trifolium subterraneum]|uniref:Uncharacterized protein n=1 Tax=Trifolium subterraneum TaxID=3900 RepID=A0A2Z6NN48_TRISU|nr:hypothetical protein TSUD_107430 [Trifolium subterraneum]
MGLKERDLHIAAACSSLTPGRRRRSQAYIAPPTAVPPVAANIHHNSAESCFCSQDSALFQICEPVSDSADSVVVETTVSVEIVILQKRFCVDQSL